MPYSLMVLAMKKKGLNITLIEGYYFLWDLMIILNKKKHVRKGCIFLLSDKKVAN